MASGVRGKWGDVQEPPAPNHSSHHKPHWAGREQGGAGPPLVHVRSGQCVQISKKEGCGAAAPTSPPPPKTGSRSRGRGSGSIALAIMHGVGG